MGPPYPHFCILHFGGKGTEFSSPNRSKPLCHKGFPFCHYYTLMAHLCHTCFAKRRRCKNGFCQPWSCHNGIYIRQIRPRDRSNAERRCRQNAEIHRVAVNAEVGTEVGTDKGKSPGILMIPGLFTAEKERFELSLRFTRTTPLAGEPLRPLGYFSTWSVCTKWRRERDSNPRCLSASLVFKTSAINHSAIPPRAAADSLIEVLNNYITIGAACQSLF